METRAAIHAHHHDVAFDHACDIRNAIHQTPLGQFRENPPRGGNRRAHWNPVSNWNSVAADVPIIGDGGLSQIYIGRMHCRHHRGGTNSSTMIKTLPTTTFVGLVGCVARLQDNNVPAAWASSRLPRPTRKLAQTRQ